MPRSRVLGTRPTRGRQGVCRQQHSLPLHAPRCVCETKAACSRTTSPTAAATRRAEDRHRRIDEAEIRHDACAEEERRGAQFQRELERGGSGGWCMLTALACGGYVHRSIIFVRMVPLLMAECFKPLTSCGHANVRFEAPVTRLRRNEFNRPERHDC